MPISARQALSILTTAGVQPLLWHLGLVVLLGALPLAGLFAMRWLVDAIADGLAGRTTSDAAWRQATFATAVAAATALAGNGLRAKQRVLGEHHGRRLADACTARLQDHAAALDLGDYDRPQFHDLLHRAGGEAGARPVRLFQDLAALLTAAVSLLTMACLLATVAFWLPLGVGAAAAPIAWIRQRHDRRRYAWQLAATAAQREVGYLGAALTGRATAKEVRAFGLRAAFGARLGALRGNLRASLHRLAAQHARHELLVHTVASLALFGAYLYLGAAALAGAMTIGGLVLQAQAVQRVQNGVRDLLGAAGGLAEARLFLRPYVDLLARAPAVVAAPPPQAVPPGPIALAADALTFGYPDGHGAALRDLQFTIAAGERIAVVGANGAGKSTLVKLLLRLLDPTSGRLTSHGVDLRHVAPADWRQRTSVLFQDGQPFELTLQANLCLGTDTPVDDAELWRVLDIVGLADRVRALPQGLATPLSRRVAGGIDWSQGELRRLLLARALLQPADLLVLDEPFALLDGVATTRLLQELAARPRRQTVVLVEHRAAAVRWVDRVLWLDGGALQGSGSPADLVAREPRLRRLFPDW